MSDDVKVFHNYSDEKTETYSEVVSDWANTPKKCMIRRMTTPEYKGGVTQAGFTNTLTTLARQLQMITHI